MDKQKSHWAYRPHDFNSKIAKIRRHIEENNISGWDVVSKRTTIETDMMEYEIVKFDNEILYKDKNYKVLILETRYYFEDDIDSVERLYVDLKEIENTSKEIKIKNTYDAAQLLIKHSEKNLKIEKNKVLYDVDSFSQHNINGTSIFIVKSSKLIPKEEIRGTGTSLYKNGLKAQELTKEIKKNASMLSYVLSKNFNESLECCYLFLTFDNRKLYEVTAEVDGKNIIFRGTKSLDD